jgi:TusA-related sulfurtransferase
LIAVAQEIVVDARGLEPPEPFERVMEAISDMGQDDIVLMLLEREPHPLYRVLERNGYQHRTQFRDDGVFEIRIWLKRA